MNPMNEFGERLCDALELPKHRVTGFQWTESVGEFPTVTVTVLMWSEDLKKILDPPTNEPVDWVKVDEH